MHTRVACFFSRTSMQELTGELSRSENINLLVLYATAQNSDVDMRLSTIHLLQSRFAIFSLSINRHAKMIR